VIRAPSRSGRPGRPLAEPLKPMAAGGPINVDVAALLEMARALGLQVYRAGNDGHLAVLRDPDASRSRRDG
jgi:hypothetical protein